MTMNPLTDAYRETDETGARRRRRLAATYRPDARTERLLRLQHDDPAAFDRLHPATRTAVGFYESAKAAHDAEAEAEATR